MADRTTGARNALPRVFARHVTEREEIYGRVRGVTAVSPAAMDALVGYPYPANVRELKHIIEHAVSNVPDGSAQVNLADLPRNVATVCTLAAADDTLGPGDELEAARRRVERDLIVATLARHSGRVSVAARELGVSRSTLWRMTRKYGVGVDAFQRGPRSEGA